MADTQLRDTDAEDQKDWQAEVDTDATATDATETDDATTQAADTADTTEETTAPAGTDEADATDQSDEDEDYGVPMDKVEAILNATADKTAMTPQMRRMMQRQAENTKRVEETIKGTKSNPRWFVPLFCTLMIIGLIWAVVYYLTSDYPIPNIGAWNLAIAFAFIMVGFLMTMGWR